MEVRIWHRGAIAAAAMVTGVAHADVRSGYNAWQRGDFAAAVTEWRPLAIAGDGDAQFNLGQAYKVGRGVPVDLTQAEMWFRKAADQGHLAARDNLGLVLFQGGKRAEAMPYIEDAAGRGDPRAQYVYATALFNGDLVKQDRVRAYALMTRASAAGTSAASVSLAQMDRALSADERARGLTLARAFEAHATATLPTDRDRPVVGRDEALAGPKPASVSAPPARDAATTKPAVSPAPTKTAATQPPRTPAPIKPAPIKPATIKPAPAGAAAPSGRWKVQLAALSDTARAEALWSGLHTRIGALGPYRSFIVPAGKVVRVQAGPLASRAAAERLCQALRAARQGCVVVAP